MSLARYLTACQNIKERESPRDDDDDDGDYDVRRRDEAEHVFREDAKTSLDRPSAA